MRICSNRLSEISIHAPVKGATGAGAVFASQSVDFNPRSREGSDWGRRVGPKIRQDFNPRSREGSDPVPHMQSPGQGISIHAPVKGATSVGNTLYEQGAISIHAPVKGATRYG